MDDPKQTVDLFDYLSSPRFDVAREPAPKVLLLTCIDYRFFGIVNRCMETSGLVGKYDHFVLAGASLGAMLDFSAGPCLPEPKPLLPRLHWQQVFLEHLQIVRTLHGSIDRIILIEHQACGAYDTFLGKEHRQDEETELETHRFHACRLKSLIDEHYPGAFTIDALMALLPDPSPDPEEDASRCPMLRLDCNRCS